MRPMHTNTTTFEKITLSLPKPLVEYLRHNVTNMSRYVNEAVSERVAQEKREKAFKTIMDNAPSFPDITDSGAYVRKLRSADAERRKRLGL